MSEKLERRPNLLPGAKIKATMRQVYKDKRLKKAIEYRNTTGQNSAGQ